MNGMIVNALKDKKVRDFMVKEGLDPVGSTPENLELQVKREIVKYAEVLRKGHIALQ
jgi:tripartite-type tricarboxylate transporter receptor subunit TctC